MSQKSNDKGVFVISLDFELLWGVWDVTTKEKYCNHLLGVQQVIPGLLDLFRQYDIKATFATVGFLFARDKTELLSYLPGTQPGYSNDRFDVYKHEVPKIGETEKDDPFHFGYSLFEMLRNSPHEIGTHTFCHYYCLEEGQTAAEFDADIKAAIRIAEAKGIRMNSIVFPRNQVNEEYLEVLKANGIACYRGNPTSWIYKPRKFSAEVPFIRICRLLDTYFPISGYNTHRIIRETNGPVNIPAGHFFKPYDTRFAWLEKLKLRRIRNEMTKAAQRGEVYHLWWHPHNFGIHIRENMDNLTVLLEHYRKLNKQYGFVNQTMQEAAGV
ncbi:MAG: polysaccharide deacetylase family protein [Ferruginibacter sp.]|nr:polysaccharide deacetylase family protein [Ferruginibacter sp.]